MPIPRTPYYAVQVVQTDENNEEYGGEILFAYTKPEVDALPRYTWEILRHKVEQMQRAMDQYVDCDLTRIWWCVPPTM